MNKKNNIEDLKKEIAIERLRQAPPTMTISFGMSAGKFMNRDELIENIEKDTSLGKNVVQIQLEYLKAFKKHLLVEK